LCLIYSFNLK